MSLCNSTVQPTLPKYAWTMNRAAIEGSINDTYRFVRAATTRQASCAHAHVRVSSDALTLCRRLTPPMAQNPWRRPGTAPVVDACGLAGGTQPWHAGPGVAVFANTSFAKFGDKGSTVLPPAPSGTVWRAGASVEVSWGIRFNHGGGYQYRLCAASEPLTEACFARTPLPFNRRKQALMWNNGTRLPLSGTWVDEGTYPPGSTWAMNPCADAREAGRPLRAIASHQPRASAHGFIAQVEPGG